MRDTRLSRRHILLIWRLPNADQTGNSAEAGPPTVILHFHEKIRRYPNFAVLRVPSKPQNLTPDI